MNKFLDFIKGVRAAIVNLFEEAEKFEDLSGSQKMDWVAKKVAKMTPWAIPDFIEEILYRGLLEMGYQIWKAMTEKKD